MDTAQTDLAGNNPSESKEEKFKRLAEKRVNAALDKIRLIGNLASPQYICKAEQVEAILGELKAAVGEVEQKFRKQEEKKKFHF